MGLSQGAREVPMWVSVSLWWWYQGNSSSVYFKARFRATEISTKPFDDEVLPTTNAENDFDPTYHNTVTSADATEEGRTPSVRPSSTNVKNPKVIDTFQVDILDILENKEDKTLYDKKGMNDNRAFLSNTNSNIKAHPNFDVDDLVELKSAAPAISSVAKNVSTHSDADDASRDPGHDRANVHTYYQFATDPSLKYKYSSCPRPLS